MNRHPLVMLASILVLFPALVCGKPLLDFKQTEPAETDTSMYTFSFNLSENGNRLIMNINSDLEHGTLNVWISGGGYDVIGNYTGEGTFDYDNVVFGPLNNQEPIQVKITTSKATGEWHVRFTEFSHSTSIIGLIVSGIIVLIISGGLIIWWKKRYHESMKWLWLGAGIWAIGVVLKFVVAIPANEPVLAWIKHVSGQTGYLGIGSVYIGSLTGVFEIGVTLLFALLIKNMHKNVYIALGIGLGAGVVEAILIGFTQIGNAVFLTYGGSGSAQVITSLAQTISMNSVFFLLAPVERAITILCHTSSRVLVIIAVARRKHLYFWAGFLLITGIDTIAGYAHLSGILSTHSTWWIELAILPFAIISIPVIKWCIRHWPEQVSPQGS